MNRTTIFTCSIYPDLTRVWYHFVSKFADHDQVETLIYDCGSRLDPAHFPGARIVRHPNADHGRKIDHCLQTNVTTPFVFLTDDDVFVLSNLVEPAATEALAADDRAAAFSLKPRGWWKLEIDGASHPVMGSYALVFKPQIFRDENLSFRTRPTTDPRIRDNGGYYDTADYANEQLLRRGYKVIFADDTLQGTVRSYSAVSSGFVNFARRGLMSRGRYRLSRTRAAWRGELGRSHRKLEWACGVAATIDLYRGIFDEEPAFGEFFSYDDLAEIADRYPEGADRAKSAEIVASYRELLATLTDAA